MLTSGLKKLALAGIAAAGLIATTTAASADRDDWHHHHRYHDRYYGGSSFSLSIGTPYYGGGYRDYDGDDYYYGTRYYGGGRGSDGMGGSWGYDPRYGGVIHCDRYHHWAGNHCNANW